VVFDPRADTFLPREGSGNRGRHLNHSDTAAVTTYKRATDKPVQDGAQEQDSGARVIIIRVPREDSLRPRRYGGLEWVSAPYPYRPLFCRLCMYLGPLLGTIKGEVRERIRGEHKSYVVEQPYSIPIHTTPVFTPVQALRCKIIQTLSPHWT
jgi:hypothetical protein